jgi:hypothetical protein
VSVYVADSFAHQLLAFNEVQDLFVFGDDDRGQGIQEREDLSPVGYFSASQFTDDEWMTHDSAFVQERF